MNGEQVKTMAETRHSLFLSERSFLLVLVIAIVLLYANSLDGDFVWDDRAAIVRNEDIRSHTSIFSVFLHDFWGQDIRLRLSHKSYRPLTVLTFKMDHFFYGLNAFGYHCTNVLLYVLSCWSMLWLCKTWLSPSCKSNMLSCGLLRFIVFINVLMSDRCQIRNSCLHLPSCPRRRSC